MTLGARGVKGSVSVVKALKSRRVNGDATPWHLLLADEVSISRGGIDGSQNLASRECELPTPIDLARFDDEEFETLITGEWGIGWRLNERAINCRQVLAQSLSEFLGSVEPEKMH